MSELEKIANHMKDDMLTELKDTLTAIHNEVVSVKKSTIPEVVFKVYFLDFFKSGMNTPDRDFKYAKWIELSRSPYNEVDVIDNAGNVIFTVPPLYVKPSIDDSVIDINFSNISSKYILKSNRLKSDADNYLSTELTPIGDKLTSNTEDITSRWLEIFKRYEVPKPTIPEYVSRLTAISDDDIIY